MAVVAVERTKLTRLVGSNAFTTNVVESERFLFVSVSADARPTSVSGPAGRVRIPELDIVAIMGAVSVLFVSVSDVPVPTRVVVVFGRVSVLPPLTMDAITGAVSVLLVSVSVVSLPTSLSVVVGRVSVPPLTMDENDGVVSVGDVPNTSNPVPVSSEITPASCADVVEANWLSGLSVSAGADVDHDKFPSVSPNSIPLAIVLEVAGNTRL